MLSLESAPNLKNATASQVMLIPALIPTPLAGVVALVQMA